MRQSLQRRRRGFGGRGRGGPAHGALHQPGRVRTGWEIHRAVLCWMEMLLDGWGDFLEQTSSYSRKHAKLSQTKY